jgi:hypothetical protein
VFHVLQLIDMDHLRVKYQISQYMGWPCFDPYMPQFEEKELRAQMTITELNNYRWSFQNPCGSLTKIFLLFVLAHWLKHGFRPYQYPSLFVCCFMAFLQAYGYQFAYYWDNREILIEEPEKYRQPEFVKEKQIPRIIRERGPHWEREFNRSIFIPGSHVCFWVSLILLIIYKVSNRVKYTGKYNVGFRQMENISVFYPTLESKGNLKPWIDYKNYTGHLDKIIKGDLGYQILNLKVLEEINTAAITGARMIDKKMQAVIISHVKGASRSHY